MQWSEMGLEALAHQEILCRCGQWHSTDIQEIIIEKGALSRVAEVISAQRKPDGGRIQKDKDWILMTEDIHTRTLAGNEIAQQLSREGYQVKRCYFPEKELVACDTAVEKVKEDIDSHTVLLLAVGSGTLNDVTKYAAFQKKLPFCIFGTAPSMDGYASPVAPLIIGGLKYAKDAIGPAAIIADTDILKNAPMRMMAAGFGDLVGKCVSICDWKISNLVNGEPFCQDIADTVLDAVKICVNNAELLLKRDETAVRNVMEALVLCGLMMNYAKSSRPASGSEHGLGHFWELMQLFEQMPVSMHGEGVGVGSVASCVIFRQLLDEIPDRRSALTHLESWNRKKWEKDICSFCLEGAEDVLAMEDRFRKNQAETVLPRLDATLKHWKEIQDLIQTYIPRPEEMQRSLKLVGAPACPQDLGLDETHLRNALRYAKDTRYRYSVLQLIWDLGIEDKIIEKVADYFFGREQK